LTHTGTWAVRILGLFMLLFLGFPGPLAGQAGVDAEGLTQSELLRRIQVAARFKAIDRLAVEIELIGSAADVGLTEAQIAELVRQGTGRHLAELRLIEGIESDEASMRNTGLLRLLVWTVGDNYPMAYHIEISFELLGEGQSYESATLGYGGRTHLESEIATAIESLIGEFAAFFREARALGLD
jgi:hypothetical protein